MSFDLDAIEKLALVQPKMVPAPVGNGTFNYVWDDKKSVWDRSRGIDSAAILALVQVARAAQKVAESNRYEVPFEYTEALIAALEVFA